MRRCPMPKGYRPGQRVPDSGQYKVLGPKGGDTGTEVTSVKGEPFPPTPKPNQTFVPVDPTKHKGDTR